MHNFSRSIRGLCSAPPTSELPPQPSQHQSHISVCWWTPDSPLLDIIAEQSRARQCVCSIALSESYFLPHARVNAQGRLGGKGRLGLRVVRPPRSKYDVASGNSERSKHECRLEIRRVTWEKEVQGAQETGYSWPRSPPSEHAKHFPFWSAAAFQWIIYHCIPPAGMPM
jgi:hypothetical protein